MSNDATGKVLGRILLAIVRFICGAAIGFAFFMFLVYAVGRAGVDESVFRLDVLVPCLVAGGLLGVFFGNRFFNWMKELWSAW